jgi:hypothetical protein
MPQTNESKKVVRYDHARLISDARALGSRPAEVAGALVGQKKRLSHEETRKAIDKFRNRRVEMS